MAPILRAVAAVLVLAVPSLRAEEKPKTFKRVESL